MALKLGHLTNFDMLFLMMESISLVGEIKLSQISSWHFCIRSKLYDLLIHIVVITYRVITT